MKENLFFKLHRTLLFRYTRSRNDIFFWEVFISINFTLSLVSRFARDWLASRIRKASLVLVTPGTYMLGSVKKTNKILPILTRIKSEYLNYQNNFPRSKISIITQSYTIWMRDILNVDERWLIQTCVRVLVILPIFTLFYSQRVAKTYYPRVCIALLKPH